jgi:hypothetical protein
MMSKRQLIYAEIKKYKNELLAMNVSLDEDKHKLMEHIHEIERKKQQEEQLKSQSLMKPLFEEDARIKEIQKLLEENQLAKAKTLNIRSGDLEEIEFYLRCYKQYYVKLFLPFMSENNWLSLHKYMEEDYENYRRVR